MGTANKPDPKIILAALHHIATDELLKLVDGFYFNIEDGLFELAYRTGEQGQRRRCFDLMRELRFRKSTLIRHFAKTMNRYKNLWFKPESGMEPLTEAVPQDLEALILNMAEKSSSHFSGVLRTISDRVSSAYPIEPTQLPISPHYVAQAFVLSCRSLKLDHASIEIVQDLFSRFVLDRLGSIYGVCNARLEDAGFQSAVSVDLASRA